MPRRAATADQPPAPTRRRGHNEGGKIREIKNPRTGEVVSYQVQLSVNGKRIGRNFPTREAALEWREQNVGAARKGRLSTSPVPTFGAYLRDTWLPMRESQVRGRTIVSYRLNVSRVPKWLAGMRIDDLKPADFQRFYDELHRGIITGRPLSAQTVKQVHMTMHKAMQDALRLDLVQRNATEAATTPRVAQREMHWYTDEELVRLFQTTEGDRFHALWVILGTLGLRLGEGLGLKWSDVNWERRTITVQRTLERDRRGGGLKFDETKTKNSRRTLRMTTVAVEALKAHQDRQEWDRRREGWQDRGLIFCTIFGAPLDQTRIHEHWTPACTKTGVPRYRVHDLRHSAATSLLIGGMRVHEVARFLGHTTPALVMSTYGHVIPGDHGEAAAHMERVYQQHRTGASEAVAATSS